MFRRRFVVTSLITIAGGVAAVLLVAEASMPARSWDIGKVVPCVFEQANTCLPPQR